MTNHLLIILQRGVLYHSRQVTLQPQNRPISSYLTRLAAVEALIASGYNAAWYAAALKQGKKHGMIKPSNKRSLYDFWLAYRGDLLVIVIYLAITCAMMGPVLFHMNTRMYGEGGDRYLWTWMGWWRKTALLEGLDYRFIPDQVAPFGTDHVFRVYLGVAWGLGILGGIFGEVAGFNLMIMGGISLSAIFTYALARQFKLSRPASFAAGLVYGFSAYMITHAQQHVDQTQAWVVPLFFLALVHMHNKPGIGRAVLLGLAFGVTAHFHAYYGYFVAVGSLAFVITDIVVKGRNSISEGRPSRSW